MEVWKVKVSAYQVCKRGFRVFPFPISESPILMREHSVTDSLCCDWLRYSYTLLSKEALQMLHEMGGEYTDQNSSVPFPESQYKKATLAEPKYQIRFLKESMYHVTKLFDGNMDGVQWDSKKLDNFLSLIHRQFYDLKSCVPPTVRPDKNLRRYFKKLNQKVLRKMQYSAHAWEIIRKVTKQHLQRLDVMAARLQQTKI